MYPIDFISYYGFENFDFILVGDDRFDFILDRTEIIDFELDVTSPVDVYSDVYAGYKPRPDNIIPYGENFITTEDDIPMITEDGYYLMY